MALVLADRVQETTSTTGTGTLTLAGAVSGFQSFGAIGNGNTTYYTIVSGTDWEVGLGTYTAAGTTLSRDTILSSSSGGTAISVAAGASVFCDYPAGKAILGTTSATASTGTGSVVLSNSPTLVTPNLGTPSAGVVTNLTGTASININGTVGATTPTTGSFTNLTANGSVQLTGNTTSSVSIGTATTTGGLSIGTSLTTGTLTFGGGLQTGTITIGQSSQNQIINICNGATQSGKSANIKIGANGAAGSSTTISIGSAPNPSTCQTNIHGFVVFDTNISQNPTTVALLPTVASGFAAAGDRYFVSNALAPTFGATVVGGGTVYVPVYCDGAVWKVG